MALGLNGCSVISYEIPFAQLSDGTWSVSVNHAEGQHFASRVAALNHALTEAKALARRGKATMISIEGADGRWRAFDTNVKCFANG
jgi:hypothetical protein